MLLIVVVVVYRCCESMVYDVMRDAVWYPVLDSGEYRIFGSKKLFVSCISDHFCVFILCCVVVYHNVSHIIVVFQRATRLLSLAPAPPTRSDRARLRQLRGQAERVEARCHR